jgi:hypothetical protein
MTRLNEALVCIVLALMCGLLAGAGYVGIKYVVPIAQNVRKASDTLPETMTLIRTDAKTSTDTSAAMYGMVDDLDKLIWKFDDVADAGKGTLTAASGAIAKLGTVEDAATARINALATAQAKAETAMDQVSNWRVNPLLDSLKSATDSIPPTMNGLTSYVNGPLTFATNNAGELEDTLNLTVDQGRKRWVAPWDGTHPFKHYGSAALGYVGLGATIMRDAK